ISLTDILHRLTDQFTDDLILLAVILAHGQLDLAAGAGGQISEVADARRHRRFPQDQAAPFGVADHVFAIGDRHADTDAGLLIDGRTTPRQPSDFLADLFHAV